MSLTRDCLNVIAKNTKNIGILVNKTSFNHSSLLRFALDQGALDYISIALDVESRDECELRKQIAALKGYKLIVACCTLLMEKKYTFVPDDEAPIVLTNNWLHSY